MLLPFGFFQPKYFSFIHLYSPKSRHKWLLFPNCSANLDPFSFWLINLSIICKLSSICILFILIHILTFYCNLLLLLLLLHLYPNAFSFICFWGHLQTILCAKKIWMCFSILGFDWLGCGFLSDWIKLFFTGSH